MADTKKYTTAGTNIKHNGTLYEAGAKIELTEEEAAGLKKHLTETDSGQAGMTDEGAGKKKGKK